MCIRRVMEMSDFSFVWFKKAISPLYQRDGSITGLQQRASFPTPVHINNITQMALNGKPSLWYANKRPSRIQGGYIICIHPPQGGKVNRASGKIWSVGFKVVVHVC